MVWATASGIRMLGRATLMLSIGLCAMTAAGAVPVEETAYGKSGLRLEIRPDPGWMRKQAPFTQTEGIHAQAGIGARWIAVVDPLAKPYFVSKAIPTDIGEAAANDALFKEWVAALHEQELPVLSWYPLIFSKSGVAAHPEWRQRFLVPEPAGHTKGITACFHTGFGDALIDFCSEAIERYGIDGFWFDGSAWTQIWDRPLPLSCVCDACRVKFRADTGLDLPAKVDWSDPTFRRWVAWRYDAFGAYIGRLARGIRSKHPGAAVVVNHYHRPAIPWQGAIPLNPYDADIITGSEATGLERVDLTMRLCTAYGRKQSEVWRPFHVGGDRETDDLIHHALACITAGGMPSYGGGLMTSQQAIAAVKSVAGVIDALRPWVGGEPVKDVALHLSQQTETFHFSRAPKGVGWDVEPYWAAIGSWTDSLGGAHRSPTYLYDRSLAAENLAGYRMLLMPMSQALSLEQAACVIDFVRAGGTVLLGPGCAQLDEWGEARAENPLSRAFEFAMEGAPSPAADETVETTLVPAGGGEPIRVQGLRTPVRLGGTAWQVLYRHGADAAPAIAARALGKGRVVLTDMEPSGASSSWQAVSGGDTSIAVTEERARQEKRALRLVDGPNAEHSFFPDMEMTLSPFGLPRFAGGRFSCDLRLDPKATVNIELRHRLGQEARLGPSVSLGGGKVSTHRGALGDLPAGEWLRVEITWRFADDGATYDLEITGEKGARARYTGLQTVHPDFAGCNWAVLFGAGKDAATFYVDDLRIERVDGAGAAQTVLADDFESTPVGGTAPARSMQSLHRVLLQLAPRSPVEVDAPVSVRAGIFRQGERTIVHLHHREATHKEWRRPAGPPVTLHLDAPVKRASLALSGEELPLRREAGRTVLVVSHVGLHEVLLLEP